MYSQKHDIYRDKKFSKFSTSLAFVYNSMSLKCFYIEQLCPFIDSMILLVFCTLHQYVNLNVNENHIQYVHSKTDDAWRVTHYTV